MTDRATVLKRALSEIETLRRRVVELESTPTRAEPMAVVGLACRLPGGVVDPESFWTLLADGVDATREVPADRWPIAGLYATEPAPGKTYVRRGGYLDDVAGFDPALFGLSPRETQRMDPQQRLLLETNWEALERAGQPITALAGSDTGVFVGNTTSDFAHLQMKYVDLALLDGHFLTGNSPSFLAGRVAFHFGLRGPALAVDTSCSSSLVAVHLACQSLGLGECRMALVSGVNLMLFPELNASLCGARMLAPDGRCKTFDAGADGYARGEGCATVVLKRLADAQADGDPIVAVIRGSAINHDGRSSGITVPNGAAQQDVLRRALARAGLRPAEVDYLEAHGTGTSLGDPIEVRALGAVLGEGRSPSAPLVLGSVKTNFGHLEGAAGIAGLIKVILALERGEVPPHLNLETLNPAIDLAAVPARLATERLPWPERNGGPRIAGVSSFGASGTNAHVLVASPPSLPPSVTAPQADSERRHVLALSAHDEVALRQLAGRFAEHLTAHPEQDLGDICATVNRGRARLRHRLALDDRTVVGMASRLAAIAAPPTDPASTDPANTNPATGIPAVPGVHVAALPRRANRWGQAGVPMAFLFTGQGAQYAAMGRTLFDTEPVFRQALERCDSGLRDTLEQPLLEVLYGAQGALLEQTAYTQPALFALEYALAETWRAWGVQPAVVLGHSVGEYVAAWAAGVLSLDDALRLIARRGQLMQGLPAGGGMAAVALNEDAARSAIEEHGGTLTLAAVNGPSSTVLSGDRAVLDRMVTTLAARGVKTKALAVSHAFHSKRMEPMLDELEAAAAEVTWRPPRVELIANLSGRVIDNAGRVGGDAGDLVFGSPAYWRQHARQPVRFAASVAALDALGIDVLLELGPAPTLLGLARQCPRVDERVLVPSLRRGRDDRQQMLSSVAELFVRGTPIDWRGVDGGQRHRRVALPTYPFQRRRFWLEPHELTSPPEILDGTHAERHPFLGCRLPTPLAGAQYTTRFGVELQPLLGDFGLFGHVVVNIGVYVEAFAAAARDALGVAEPVIEEIVMPQALLLGDGDQRPVHLVVGDGHDGEHAVQLFAQPADDPSVVTSATSDATKVPWTLYAGGRLRADPALPEPPSMTPDSLRPTGAKELDGTTFYAAMESRGLKLGPAARWLERIWRADGTNEDSDQDDARAGATVLARLRQPTAADEADRYELHPGLIDCCFQLFFATLATTGLEREPDALFMLVGVERLRLWDTDSDWGAEVDGADAGELWCHVRRDPAREGTEPGQVVAGDITVVTGSGQPVMMVTGAELRRVDRPALERSLAAANSSRPATTMASTQAAAGSSQAARQTALKAIRDAAADDRPRLVRAGVVAAVAHVLGFATTDIDPEQPLSELGIDSLLALELRTALGDRLGGAPSLARILEGPAPTRLAARLLADIVPLSDSDGEDADGAEARADDPEATALGTASEVTSMTDTVMDTTLPPVIADPENRHQPFPFTDLQEAYFFGRTGAFELGNVSTYVTMEVDVDGLDIERLDAAWQRMIDRHEMLRAEFLPEGCQRILPAAPKAFTIGYRDLAMLDDARRAQTLRAIRQEMVAQVLPADGWPLFDLRVSHLGGGRSRLHIGLDALVMDAWGTSVVFKEWAAAYHRPTVALPPLEVSFRDYSLALKALEETPVYQRDLAYWLDRVRVLPPAPELPLVRDSSSLARPEFTRRSGRLEAPVWQRLKARATAAGLTPSTMMCTLYAAVLAEWSKSKHFTLNVLYFNRPPLHPQVNDIAANLSATILLEVDAREPRPFLDCARALARRFWDDLEHSHVTGVRVLREYNRLHAGRAQAGMPVVFASTLALDVRQGDLPSGLFQHLLGLGSDGAVVHTTARTPQVMLDHQIMEEAGALVYNWDVVEALFPPGMVDDMFDAYCVLLDRLVTDEDAWRMPVSEGLVPAAQLARRVLINATDTPVAAGLLHEPFLAQAAAHPERPAVIAADRTLSYGELSARAQALAHELRAAGVRPNQLVGIVLEKGWPQVVATLAVGLAGGAYLPIDPNLPSARVRYLLDHGGVAVALLYGEIDPLATRDAGADAASAADAGWPEAVTRLWVDTEPPTAAPAMLSPAQSASDLAYVIFTSGSTGLPKGVMIDHWGALNTVLDVNQRFGVGPDDRVLAISALNFDLSVWDIFGLLAAGGAIVMPPTEALREPGRWTELLDTHGVTVWNSVPALMEMWVDSRPPSANSAANTLANAVVAGGTLRLVMMSGDWIPVTLPDRIRAQLGDSNAGVDVISLGGATEASIWSILYPIGAVDPAWSSIPYGRPMANQRFHVLDDALQARPNWVPGELYIAGIGVAQGYWRDAERTAASFIEHPVSGERLYRTGDLGRYLPDGTIEFLGREDFQVKIQGYRIELGEIEVALAQHPAVASCAVVAQGAQRGNKRLVAFVVPASAAAGAGAADEDLATRLRTALGEQIASYMVPAAFVVVGSLPLTANGKVDRGALARTNPTAAAGNATDASDASGPDGTAPVLAPRDAVEAELAALWQDLLDRDTVGMNEDFFDLGGHSLLAVRMMVAIESGLGCQLTLATIFEGRTVAHLAAVIRRHRDDTAPRGQEIVVTIQAPMPAPEPSSTSEAPSARAGLFCVHPVSGSVLCYAPLARALGREQPFYGLQAPADLETPDLETPDLETLAAAYVDAMRAVQPAGPYHLAGWSMGGMVAYEMARQLVAAGERVAFVGLIDVAEPPTGPPVAVDDATLMTWFARDLAGLMGPTSSTSTKPWVAACTDTDADADTNTHEAQLAALAEWAVAAGALPPGISATRLAGLFDVFQRNYRALLAYRPVAANVELTLFHVADTEAVATAWAALASGAVRELLAGDHYSIVRPPRVTTLARRLRRALADSSAHPLVGSSTEQPTTAST